MKLTIPFPLLELVVQQTGAHATDTTEHHQREHDPDPHIGQELLVGGGIRALPLDAVPIERRQVPPQVQALQLHAQWQCQRDFVLHLLNYHLATTGSRLTMKQRVTLLVPLLKSPTCWLLHSTAIHSDRCERI